MRVRALSAVPSLSAAGGWAAIAAIPFTAVLGAVLRRATFARLALRMRPHYVLGYGALATAVAHVVASARSMGSADVTGIWIGALALLVLILQAFVGASLQAPGAYRALLRRWHAVAFWSALVFALAHAALDAPYLTGMLGATTAGFTLIRAVPTAFAPVPRSDRRR
jgi:hypothetical protein